MYKYYQLLKQPTQTVANCCYKHIFSSAVKMAPKKQKSSGKLKVKAATAAENCEKVDNSAVIVLNKDKDVVIKIQAKPGAKQNAITGISDEGVRIQIAAPPMDGEANTELIKYLAKVLSLRKSDLSLDKGSRSRQKCVCVSGLSLDEVTDKIKSEIG